MDTTTQVPQEIEPIPSDIGLNVPLSKQLEGMTKAELIQYADKRMGFSIDSKFTKEKVKEEILKIDAGRRKTALEESNAAAHASASDDDPLINVVYHNMQSSDEDITFQFPGPKGMRGPVNKTGHKKCPSYHLFPGMEIELPYSVIEHLRSKTYLRHKAVYDPVTGMQNGTIPIITPRFILEQRLTKEQAIALSKMQ